jgi:diguanylate cyclase (GGDEF)-like protein
LALSLLYPREQNIKTVTPRCKTMNNKIDQYLDHRLYEFSTYQPCHHSITQADTQKVAMFQCFSLVTLLILLSMPLAWASTGEKTIQDVHSFNSRNLSFMRHSLEQGLSQSSGNAIVQDHLGFISFGTQEGLNRYDGYKIEVFEHDHKNPASLTNDWIWSLLVDKAGVLWLSSNHGLQRFDPNSGEVRMYDISTDLKGNEFNTLARFKNQDGRMYFGGTTGLVAFYPNQIRTNQHQPDIVLSSHTRLDPLDSATSDLPQGTETTNHSSQDSTRELGYKEDLITFEFAGLDFTAPEKNLYRYKLEGFDADWTAPATFKRTTYTNLPAGAYTFRVMASNNDGIWNTHGKAITLQVIPPPWKTGWAYALYAFIAISLVIVYLRAQAKKLRQEVEQRIELEEQVQLRTHEIAERNEQLQGLNKLLKDASVTDTLTGLNNRRYMDEFIEAEVAQANRLAKGMNESGDKTTVQDIAPALSFMMIDLDGFKAINDTYGHHAGDQALIQVREILQQCCRQSDTIIRWGGDEFLIVSRNTNAQSVETLAERIRTRLADQLYQQGGGHIGRLSGSIGFALYPFSLQDPDLVPWEQVANIADRGAYVAKENGRNAWVGLFGTQNTTTEDLTRIKHELGDLVEKDSLRINTSIAGELNLGDQKATPRATA